jgi:hypothetical protein
VPPPGTTAPFRIAAACLLALILLEHGQYINAARSGPQPTWLLGYEEVTAVTDWVRENLPDRSPIASSNPGLVYLATGRRTVALSNPQTHLDAWQQLGIRYAVALHQAEKPPQHLEFRTLYESPKLKLWVVAMPAELDRK